MEPRIDRQLELFFANAMKQTPCTSDDMIVPDFDYGCDICVGGEKKDLLYVSKRIPSFDEYKKVFCGNVAAASYWFNRNHG